MDALREDADDEDDHEEKSRSGGSRKQYAAQGGLGQHILRKESARQRSPEPLQPKELVVTLCDIGKLGLAH
ncbi:hypothetical protein AXG93_2767s1020 [Marchantia polymorpha subsp. ruderalis]|uniref:Uncharacterized protein n=1 Tax=Marchantia polymorpha subsp. ruderalis TaxID=1480154 RepID=A0A176VUX0_MARPO|nr:hypothetical protein AXG93_2767s1020 [Marchantia polymorpha subsp. ruderalis]